MKRNAYIKTNFKKKKLFKNIKMHNLERRGFVACGSKQET